MRRPALGTLLALANAGLVLLTVGALAGAGGLLVRRLLLEQAHGRLQVAAATAAREVGAAAERLEVTAKLLADRPTMQRLSSSTRNGELRAFLLRFQQTGRLEGVAVLRNGRGWAVAGELPALERLPKRPRPPFLLVDRDQPDPLALVASAELGSDGTTRVIVVQRLDRAFTRALARQVGTGVRLAPGMPDSNAGLDVGQAALAPELGAAAHVDARLATTQLDLPLQHLLREYGLLAAAGAVLALIAGLVVGRRVGAPANRLAAAAGRIGQGDLRTPIDPAAGVEMGRLAATLEEMRRRLLAATSELERREAEATAVLTGVVEGVLAVDSDRKVTYLNAQASRLLGVEAETARGRFCGDLLRPEEVDGVLPCHDRCPIVHARGRGTATAIERVRPFGKSESGKGDPRKNEAGKTSMARDVVVSCSAPIGGAQVLVLRDETEQEAGRRTREAILANLSHELKTPLAAQLASVELLRDGLGEGMSTGESTQLVSALERSTLRLMSLVDNLLLSSRLEAGEWGMRAEEVELAEVGHEAASLLAPLFAQRRQVLACALADLPAVRGDRTQLLQVLLNLLGNANKFAPEGTVVRLGGEAQDDAVALWVEDQGPGLPPGGAEPLFERFRRAPGVAPRGVGLGLWIARAIVERHGGTVGAETASSGGARFVVKLPALPSDADRGALLDELTN